MNINVELDGFTGLFHSLNGNKAIQVNQLDLVRGILTAGRANIRSVLKGGMLRIMEMIGMSMQVFAYTTLNGSALATSSLYRDLDRSEKAAASYRFGMGIAKLISEVTIRVPWLMHTDPLISSGVSTLTSGSHERGDFVGQDSKSDWHVVEAKARSNHPPFTLYSKAKKQASRIISINGANPVTHCASIANLSSIPISAQFLDPEEEPIEYEPVSIEVDETAFYTEYYFLIRQFIADDYPFKGSVAFMLTTPSNSDYALSSLGLEGVL